MTFQLSTKTKTTTIAITTAKIHTRHKSTNKGKTNWNYNVKTLKLKMMKTFIVITIIMKKIMMKNQRMKKRMEMNKTWILGMLKLTSLIKRKCGLVRRRKKSKEMRRITQKLRPRVNILKINNHQSLMMMKMGMMTTTMSTLIMKAHLMKMGDSKQQVNSKLWNKPQGQW